MSVSGPTVVRRQLGRRLKQARIAAGKTVDDVVTSGVLSKATLHRFESGRSRVTPGSVLQLGMIYELDHRTTMALYDLAVGSQDRGWWEDLDAETGAEYGLYIGLESAAVAIHAFMPEVVFGLFQTPDYAHAMERVHYSEPCPATVDRRVGLRLRRQEVLFGREPAVRLRVILGPGALARQVGGAQVMAAQHARLRQLAADERVTLRVLPWEAGAHPAIAGGFTLMEFADPDDPTVAYVESAAGSSYFEAPEQVSRYRRIIGRIWQQSVAFEEYSV